MGPNQCVALPEQSFNNPGGQEGGRAAGGDHWQEHMGGGGGRAVDLIVREKSGLRSGREGRPRIGVGVKAREIAAADVQPDTGGTREGGQRRGEEGAIA